MASSGVVTYSSLAWATRVPPQQPNASKCEPARESTQDPKHDGLQTPPVRSTTDVPAQPLTYRDIVAQQRATKSTPLKKPLVEAHTEQAWPLPKSARSAPVRVRTFSKVETTDATQLLQVSTTVTTACNPMLALSIVQATEGQPPDGRSYTSDQFDGAYDVLAGKDRSFQFADTPEVAEHRKQLATATADAFSKMDEKELTNIYCAQSLLRCGAFLEYLWFAATKPFNLDRGEHEPLWNVNIIHVELASNLDVLGRVEEEIWHGRNAMIAVASGLKGSYKNDFEMLNLVVGQIEALKRQDLIARLMREMIASRAARQMANLTDNEKREARQQLVTALESFRSAKDESLSELFRKANENMGHFTKYLGNDTDFVQSNRLSTVGSTRQSNIMADTAEIATYFLGWYDAFLLLNNNPTDDGSNVNESLFELVETTGTTDGNHSDDVLSVLVDLAQVQHSSFYDNSDQPTALPLETASTEDVLRSFSRVPTEEEQAAYNSLAHDKNFTSGRSSPQSEPQTPRASFARTPATPPRSVFAETPPLMVEVREAASALNRSRIDSYAASIATLGLTFVDSQLQFDKLCNHAGAALSRALIARHAVAQRPAFSTQRGSNNGIHNTFVVQVAEATLGQAVTKTKLTSKSPNNATTRKQNLLRDLQKPVSKGGLMMLQALMALKLTWLESEPTAWHSATIKSYRLREYKECARTGPEQGSCSAIRVAAELLWPLVRSETIEWTFTRDGGGDAYNLKSQQPIHSWPGLMDAHLRAHDVWETTDGTDSEMLPQHLKNLSCEYEMLTYAIYCGRVLKYTQTTYPGLYQALQQNVNALTTDFFSKSTEEFFAGHTAVNTTFNIPPKDKPSLQESLFEGDMLADGTLLSFLCNTVEGLRKGTPRAAMRVLMFCVHVSHLTEKLLIEREYCSARSAGEILQKLSEVAFKQDEQEVAQLHDPLTVLQHMFDLLCARHALVRYTDKTSTRHEAISAKIAAITPQLPTDTKPNKVMGNLFEPHYNNTNKLQRQCAAGNAEEAWEVLTTSELQALQTMVLMVPCQNNTLREILHSTMAAVVLQSLRSRPDYLTSAANVFALDASEVAAFSVVDAWRGDCNDVMTVQAEVTLATMEPRNTTKTKREIIQQVRATVSAACAELSLRVAYEPTADGLAQLQRTIEDAAHIDRRTDFRSLESILERRVRDYLADQESEVAFSAKLSQMFAILKDEIRKYTESIEAVYLSLSVPVYPLMPVHAYPFYMGLQPLPDQTTLATKDLAHLVQVAKDIGVEVDAVEVDAEQNDTEALQRAILNQINVHKTHDVWSREWVHTYAAGGQRGTCQVPMHDFRACDPNPGVAEKDAFLRLREIACTTQVQTQEYDDTVHASITQADSAVASLKKYLPFDANTMYACTRAGLTLKEADKIIESMNRSRSVFSARSRAEGERKRLAQDDDAEIVVILKANLNTGQQLAEVLADAKPLTVKSYALSNWRQAIHGLQTTIESASLRHSLTLLDARHQIAYRHGDSEDTGINSRYIISHGVTLYARRTEIMTVTILREMGWAMLRAYENTEPTYDCSLVVQILSMPESAFGTDGEDAVARTAPFAAAVCVLAGCCRSYLQMTKYDLLWEAMILTNEPVDTESFDDDEYIYTQVILPHRQHDLQLKEFIDQILDGEAQNIKNKGVEALQEFGIVFVEQLQDHPRWEQIEKAWTEKVAGMSSDAQNISTQFINAVAALKPPVTMVGKGCTLPLGKIEFQSNRLEQVFAQGWAGGGTTFVQKVQTFAEDRDLDEVVKDLTNDQVYAIDEKAELSTQSDVAPEEQQHLVTLAMHVFRKGADPSDTASQFVQGILMASARVTEDYIDVALRKSTLAETALLAQVLPCLTGHGQNYIELSPADRRLDWQLKWESHNVKQLGLTLNESRDKPARQFANATVGVLFGLLEGANDSDALWGDFGKVLQLGMDVFWRVQVLFVHHVLLLKLRSQFVAGSEAQYERALERVLDFWAVYSSTCNYHWQNVQELPLSSRSPVDLQVAVTIKPQDELSDCWVRYADFTNMPVSFATQVAEIMNGDINTAQKLQLLRQKEFEVTSIVHANKNLDDSTSFQVGLKTVTDLADELGAQLQHCSFLNVPNTSAKIYKVQAFLPRHKLKTEGGNFPLVQLAAEGRDPAYLQMVDLREGYLVDFTGTPPPSNQRYTSVKLPSHVGGGDDDDDDGDGTLLHEIDSFKGLTYDKYFQLAATLHHERDDAATTRALQIRISSELRKFTLDPSTNAYSDNRLFTVLRDLSATCLERSFEDKAFGSNATMSTVVQLN